MLSPADRNNQLRKRLAIWLLVNSVLLTLATIKTTSKLHLLTELIRVERGRA